jgi:hypothetical protein
VIWRGMSIGRIFLGAGAPHDRPQWSWSCHLPGRPQASDERGTGVDFFDCKMMPMKRDNDRAALASASAIQGGVGPDTRGPIRGRDRTRAPGRRDQRRGVGAV